MTKGGDMGGGEYFGKHVWKNISTKVAFWREVKNAVTLSGPQNKNKYGSHNR
jgi:hypothetical protein